MKYLRYSIGEIALVVIGILIALSINNWNEDRKLRQIEIKLLSEIKNDLDETLLEVKFDLKAHKLRLDDSNTLKKILKSEHIVSDSIGYYFSSSQRDYQAYPKTSGYNLLESKGMDIISKDSLRTKITNLYQLTLIRLVEQGKLNPRNDIEEKLGMYERKHFKQTDSIFRTYLPEGVRDTVKFYFNIPKTIEELKNDNSFFIDLQNTVRKRLVKIGTHESAILEMEEIIDDIVRELEIIQ